MTLPASSPSFSLHVTLAGDASMNKDSITLLLVGLSACGLPTSMDENIKNSAATNTTWALRELDGQSIVSKNPETVTVRLGADHVLSGTSVCNHVDGGEILWKGDPFARSGTFDRDPAGATITTAVGCADTQSMTLGSRFWAQMASARSWSFQGSILTIRFADGSKAQLSPAANPERHLQTLPPQ